MSNAEVENVLLKKAWGLEPTIKIIDAGPNWLLIDTVGGARQHVSMACPKAYDELHNEITYAIDLLDGNEDDDPPPNTELIRKLQEHLEVYRRLLNNEPGNTGSNV